MGIFISFILCKLHKHYLPLNMKVAYLLESNQNAAAALMVRWESKFLPAFPFLIWL